MTTETQEGRGTGSPRLRGMASTACALASVTLMLVVARNAGLSGAAPIGLVVTAAAAIAAVALVVAAVRAMGRELPDETAVRMMIETAAMIAVATPVLLVVAIAAGWVG